MTQVNFVPSNLQSMAQAMVETFNESLIELYQHDQLLSDLRSLRVEERGYGVRLVSPRTGNGHGDVASGLGIAMHVARQNVSTSYISKNDRLVVWP